MTWFKNQPLYQGLRAVLLPAWQRSRLESLQRKYRDHSYDKSFDWPWTDTNYNRIALVNLLVARRPDCRYLEIGCANNALFDSVPAARKVGVDPIEGGNVRMTSDEFFNNNAEQFDVIFIDGLHTYEQVRRDVVHSIAALRPNGWIAMHDMLPRNWLEHHVPMLTMDDWTGDVWKVAFELASTEGIELKILLIDHGVGVFRLTAENPVLADRQTNLADREFDFFYERISQLPLVEWSACQKWLDG